MNIHSLFSHTARKWLILAVKLLGITAASAVCLFYLSGKITKTTRAVEQARASLAAFHAKYDLLGQVRGNKEFIEPHLARLEAAIPTVDSFPVVSDYISGVAIKTSNVLIARFDPIPTLNERALRELSFSLNIKGNLSSIERFLAELETAPYFVEVRSVSVTLTSGLAGQAAADLTGVIYLKDTTL